MGLIELLELRSQLFGQSLKLTRNRRPGRVRLCRVCLKPRFLQCSQDCEDSNVWLNLD